MDPSSPSCPIWELTELVFREETPVFWWTRVRGRHTGCVTMSKLLNLSVLWSPPGACRRARVASRTRSQVLLARLESGLPTDAQPLEALLSWCLLQALLPSLNAVETVIPFC